jgi:hypothetical protein
VDQGNSAEILNRIYEYVPTERLELWPNGWVPQHENAVPGKAV